MREPLTIKDCRHFLTLRAWQAEPMTDVLVFDGRGPNIEFMHETCFNEVACMKNGLSPTAYVALFMTMLLGLFGLTWVYTATQRVNFLPEQYGLWRAHLKMISQCDVGNVVILGASRAHVSFVPRLLGIDAVNLAMTSTTPIEAYYEALSIYHCPQPPKVAILSFAGRDLETTPFFWDTSARYGLLKYDDLQEIAQHANELKYPDLYTGAFGSQPPPSMKNWLYANNFPPYDFSSLLAAKLGRYRRKQSIKWFDETLSARGQHVLSDGKCANSSDFEASQSSFMPSALHVYYLNKILKLFRRHGVKVLWISTPMNRLTYKGLHGSYMNDYNAFLKQVEMRHPGFQVIGPTFQSYGLCDFSDSNHLNQAGAEKFSRSIAPLIAAALTNSRG